MKDIAPGREEFYKHSEMTALMETTCSGPSEPLTGILCGCSRLQGPDPKAKIMGGSVPANVPQDSSRAQGAHFYIHMERLLREGE